MEKKKHLNKALLIGVLAVVLLAGVSTVTTIVAQEIEEEEKKAKPEIEGSANVGEVINDFIEENRNTSFSGAAETAENVLADSQVVKGQFSTVQGYLVYTFVGVDSEEQQKYKVIIDAGNGEVLYQSDAISMEKFKKFHSFDVSAEVNISEAAATAESEIENGLVKMGMLRIQDDNAVYTFVVTDNEQKMKYFVTVDADSGEVIEVSEGMPMKSWGFHGKQRHGYKHGHMGYSDKDKDRTEGNSSTATGQEV